MTSDNDSNKFDIENGSDFPDISKALSSGSLDDFVKDLQNQDKEIFKLAQDKKQELNKQRNIDLKSFALSIADAVERGNSNSCTDKANYDNIGNKQRSQQQQIVVASTKSKPPIQTTGRRQKDLPKTRNIAPVTGQRSRPSTLANFRVNRGVPSAVSRSSHYVQPVCDTLYPDKSKRNAQKFMALHYLVCSIDSKHDK